MEEGSHRQYIIASMFNLLFTFLNSYSSNSLGCYVVMLLCNECAWGYTSLLLFMDMGYLRSLKKYDARGLLDPAEK